MSFKRSELPIYKWARFLVGGAANTLLTYSAYLTLKHLLPYQTAYLFGYMFGIVFSYWFNSYFVFRVALSWRKFLSYPLVYAVQYAASALLLFVMVELIGIDTTFAPLVVTAAMVPLTYVMSKLALMGAARRNRQ